ncbi:MAG: hypothetical protein K0Q89_5 [Thermomicrobiales bacterium]|jgi:hypothetical protein|nr:hypothetical protein [Thermomicrobiales bacterium]
MCKIEWQGGSHLGEDIVEPGHASSNGDTWVLSRYQMRDLGDGRFEPTGRTERIDQLTECQVTGDEGTETLVVTGQSTFLEGAGVPEDDRSVTVKITQNPRHR